MSINFQHLRAFYAVANDRSVTRAANRLGVSQPTLSKQLKALENRYQVKLIGGVRPPLTLTPAGEVLFELARRLFDVSADIEALLGETPPEAGGLLRLGTDSPPYAADLVAAYMKESPNLEFKVSIANAGETNTLLMSASVDVAIVCEPVGHNDYTYQPFYEDELRAVVPADWPAEQGAFDLRCLNDQVLLVRETTSRTRATMNRMLGESGATSGRLMEFHTREMIREAIAQKIGISFMFARECPPDARLRILPIAGARRGSGRITGYIACRTERRRHPAIRKAFEIAGQLRASGMALAAE